LLATVDINNPDEIVSVQGFIWVKTDDGRVVQVDPATNTVVADIKVDTTTDPSRYCQGLGADENNVWACSASGDADQASIDVVRIDPKSRNVVATVNVGKIFGQFEMPFLDNQIWVLSGNGDKLVGIDVTTNQPNPAIDLGLNCNQIAPLNEFLLASCTKDNIILKIDSKTSQVVDRISVETPHFIVSTKDSLWVTQDNSVVRLDARTLRPIADFSKLFNVSLTGDIFATDDSVWVRQDQGFLYRIDLSSNEMMEQIQTANPLSGGSLIITSDSIWTTASDDGKLFRLSRKQ
jgi:outer membrane protein assembly factor BamB